MLFHQSKGVIIVGCSPFGAALANTLYHRGHKVVVLDKDRESFRRAGMIIAATQDDNSNLLISQIASSIFQVGRVYARLDDTSRCRLITDMPIQPISLYNLSADDYKDLADSVSREVAV